MGILKPERTGGVFCHFFSEERGISHYDHDMFKLARDDDRLMARGILRGNMYEWFDDVSLCVRNEGDNQHI